MPQLGAQRRKHKEKHAKEAKRGEGLQWLSLLGTRDSKACAGLGRGAVRRWE
jgi:hypothetical protein